MQGLNICNVGGSEERRRAEWQEEERVAHWRHWYRTFNRTGLFGKLSRCEAVVFFVIIGH